LPIYRVNDTKNKLVNAHAIAWANLSGIVGRGRPWTTDRRVPRFFIIKIKKNTATKRIAIAYKTELQLFSKKCRVKSVKHLNLLQEEQKLLKTGKIFPTKSHKSRII